MSRAPGPPIRHTISSHTSFHPPVRTSSGYNRDSLPHTHAHIRLAAGFGNPIGKPPRQSFRTEIPPAPA